MSKLGLKQIAGVSRVTIKHTVKKYFVWHPKANYFWRGFPARTEATSKSSQANAAATAGPAPMIKEDEDDEGGCQCWRSGGEGH